MVDKCWLGFVGFGGFGTSVMVGTGISGDVQLFLSVLLLYLTTLKLSPFLTPLTQKSAKSILLGTLSPLCLPPLLPPLLLTALTYTLLNTPSETEPSYARYAYIELPSFLLLSFFHVLHPSFSALGLTSGYLTSALITAGVWGLGMQGLGRRVRNKAKEGGDGRKWKVHER